MRPLRFLTYLAPGISIEFFRNAVEAVAAQIGNEATLESETSVSGPSLATDPFRSGRADFAFVCAPSYPLLSRSGSARLVGAAPVPCDPRACGRPVYFADTVVRRDHPATEFAGLRGGVWTYNDPASLSGWHSMRYRLAALGHLGGPESFFRALSVSGSHRASVRLVASGAADGSAIDSNALAIQLREDPGLAQELRIIETWGPLPIQPLIAARSLGRQLSGEVAAALLDLDRDPRVGALLPRYGFTRFAPVEPAFYASFPILAMETPPAGSG